MWWEELEQCSKIRNANNANLLEQLENYNPLQFMFPRHARISILTGARVIRGNYVQWVDCTGNDISKG